MCFVIGHPKLYLVSAALDPGGATISMQRQTLSIVIPGLIRNRPQGDGMRYYGIRELYTARQGKESFPLIILVLILGEKFSHYPFPLFVFPHLMRDPVKHTVQYG